MTISQADFGVALTLFCITLVVFVYNQVGPLRRLRREADKYEFYAIRQELVALVAEKRVDRDDEGWHFLYRSVNELIKHLDSLSLKTTIRAIKCSTVLEVSEERLKSLRKNPDLQRLAVGIFLKIIRLLMRRSLVVRCALRGVRVGVLIRCRLKRLSRRIMKPRVEAYEICKSAIEKNLILATG